MSYIKKTLALVLILAMTLGLVFEANAAGSPDVGPVNPGYDPATDTDTDTQDDAGNVHISVFTDGKVILTEVQGDGTSAGSKAAINDARDENNIPVPITDIGDGKTGVLDSKLGRKVTSLVINTGADNVTLNKNALSGSKVSKLTVKNRKVKIRKNAFKNTKAKNPKIKLTGLRTASDLTLSKGAFNGLGADTTIVVSSKMSGKQYRKLYDKLVKAGFKGTLKRN